VHAATPKLQCPELAEGRIGLGSLRALLTHAVHHATADIRAALELRMIGLVQLRLDQSPKLLEFVESGGGRVAADAASLTVLGLG
jgi:hypothetical protein